MSNLTESNDNEERGTDTNVSRNRASSPSLNVDELVAALSKHHAFNELLGRAVQSVKDRRFSDQGKRLDEFEERLRRLKELTAEGMSESQALQWMKVEKLLDADKSATEPQKLSQETGTTNFDADAFLKAVGISTDDPEVASIYRSGKADANALAELVIRRKSQTTANPAQAMPTNTGSVPAPEDLQAQYQKEMREAMARGASTDEKAALRLKYRKLGLKI